MRLIHYRILVAMLAAIIAVSANAKITGKIVDATDKSPLMEATLKLVKANRDSTFVNGATSNEDGLFVVPTSTAGKYVLKVTYLGYIPQNVAVTVKVCHKPQVSHPGVWW